MAQGLLEWNATDLIEPGNLGVAFPLREPRRGLVYELEFRKFDQFMRWQEVAIALLTKYCDRLYKQSKSAFEYDKLEYGELELRDANFVGEYEVRVARSQTTVIEALRALKGEIEVGDLRVFRFDHHLYSPLIYAKGRYIEVKPVALNAGERDFVLGLREYCQSDPVALKERELYMLRNRSRAGIGFFEAGNFYPDFILWLVDGAQQRLVFIDPKGIRNLEGIDDPKIRFASSIKNLEGKLGVSNIVLDSYILSVTPHTPGGWWSNSVSKPDFASHHVLFAEDGYPSVIDRMLTDHGANHR